MGTAVILLTFVTMLAVLAGAIYDLRMTEKSIKERRHSTMTTPESRPSAY